MRPEERIEKAFVRWAERQGSRAIKLRADGRKGFPDRTVITPHRIFFIEFKAPRGKVSQQQHKWLQILRSFGFTAEICSSLEEAMDLYEREVS